MRILDDPEDKAPGTVAIGAHQITDDGPILLERYVGLEFSLDEAEEYGKALIEGSAMGRIAHV
jgi:hypothetical protein